jgi:hypothetical protein
MDNVYPSAKLKKSEHLYRDIINITCDRYYGRDNIHIVL